MIKWFTFGGYSHVSLVFDHGKHDLEEIDALQGRGVTSRAFGELANEYDLFSIECPHVVALKIHAEARQLLGCKYDWSGIWGFLRRKKRENPDKWFCSELVAHVLSIAGRNPLRLPAWKISPVMLCASPVLKPQIMEVKTDGKEESS
jgi:hypothetical protein